MTDTIERMARAMAKAVEPDLCWDLDPSDHGMQINDVSKADYRAAARAALSALEEPSEAMVEAGFRAEHDNTQGGRARATFTAMIKAAKGGEG